MPWCEASQLRVCTVNLQHCCWQVPELMSHKGKQSNGGCPYHRMPGQGQGRYMLPPRALNGYGQRGMQQLLDVTVVGPEPGTEGGKGSQSYTGDREA